MKMENVFYSLFPPALITVTLFTMYKVSKCKIHLIYLQLRIRLSQSVDTL